MLTHCPASLFSSLATAAFNSLVAIRIRLRSALGTERSRSTASRRPARPLALARPRLPSASSAGSRTLAGRSSTTAVPAGTIRLAGGATTRSAHAPGIE